MSLPNYRSCDQSPALDIFECGIKVGFAGGTLTGGAKESEVLPLYGAYGVDRADLVALGPHPLKKITITLTHEEWGTLTAYNVVGPDLLLRSNPTSRLASHVGGFFNVDLLAFCRGRGRCGWYTAFLQLGSHCSDVLRFEMLPDSCLVNVVPKPLSTDLIKNR